MRSTAFKVAGVVALLLVVVLQYSFVPLLPGTLRFVQLPIIWIIGFLLFQQPAWSLSGAAAIGMMLDIFSPDFFGLHLFALLAAAIAVHGLFSWQFTNRSLYSLLALAAIATLLYGVLVSMFHAAVGMIVPPAGVVLGWAEMLRIVGYGIIWNVVAVGLLFYLYAWLHARIIH